MLRDLSFFLTVLTAAAFAQSQRPARAETPNTDLYYKLAPDALAQDGVPKARSVDPSRCQARPIPAPSIRIGFMCLRNTTRPFPPA